MPRSRPRRIGEEGATAVETAIVMTLLCTLLFGILEFGTALWQWNTVVLAVHQAGRYAMVNNVTITAAEAEQQMWNVVTGTTGGTPSICSLTKGAINPPTVGSFCVYASAAAGTRTDPSTMTLTAAYAYDVLRLSDVLGLPGTLTVAGQGTVPLD